ncbi:MAG TPA: hypothetical protein PK199_05945 [Bacteroidales bacterium]|nr:hypothetical protein [Bacteroidales bacterium]
MKLNLTQNTKRFLIVYLIIVFFAFFVNLVGWEGKIYSEEGNYKYSTRIFTKGNDFSSKLNHFWPISSYTDTSDDIYGNSDVGYKIVYTKQFNGIFYNFDITEYIFYSLLPFIILYIKKIWESN